MLQLFSIWMERSHQGQSRTLQLWYVTVISYRTYDRLVIVILKLVFNLHDASQWVEDYNNFSFRSFYNFIIDFFESANGGTKQRVEGLLRWWNK